MKMVRIFLLVSFSMAAFAASGVQEHRVSFPISELKELDMESAIGVLPLSMKEVAALPLLSADPALVQKFIKQSAGVFWSSFYISGKKFGYSSESWTQEDHNGRPVLKRHSEIFFPSERTKHIFSTWFEVSGRGSIIEARYSVVKKHVTMNINVAKRGGQWVAVTVRNGETQSEKTLPNIEETLFNNDFAFRALLAAKQVKPGARYLLKFFSPEKCKDELTGVQLLASGTEQVAGKVVSCYKTETLSPGSGQIWKHIIGADGFLLVSRIGDSVLYSVNREGALSADDGLGGLFEKYGHFLIIGVVLLIIFFAPVKQWLRRMRER